MSEPKRIRVMHVVSSLGTYGAEHVVLHLSRALPVDAFETSVMTIYTPEPAILSAQRDAGIELFDMHRSGRFDPMLLPRMIATIARWRPDVVHTHTHYGKYWGRVAAIAARSKTIVHTEHNSEFESQRPYRAINAILHRRTAAIVSFSPIHRDRLADAESVDASRLRIIPNGIAAPDVRRDASLRRDLAGDDDAIVLIHVGRLSAVKNQALALDALQIVVTREQRPLRLVFAGDGDDRASLEERAQSLGITPYVRFLGYRTDVASLLAASDMCLVTSRNEAMPIAVLEAMFARTAIVSTPWIGAYDLFERGALAVIAHEATPAALADAIIATLADLPAAAARAQHAAARAHTRYSIGAMAGAHALLYAELNAPHTRRARPIGRVR